MLSSTNFIVALLVFAAVCNWQVANCNPKLQYYYQCEVGYEDYSLLCSKCEGGYYASGQSCLECKPYFAYLIPVLDIAAVCLVFYYLWRLEFLQQTRATFTII